MACPEADPQSVAMVAAARDGNLEMLHRLHDPGAKSKPLAVGFAASRGHVAALIWLHEFRSEGCTHNAAEMAATSGHLQVIQRLHVHKSECFTPKVKDNAARAGDLEIVKWLYLNRSEGCTIEAMDAAACQGHLHVIKWLRANWSKGCTKKAIIHAAMHGMLETVKYFYETEPDMESFREALHEESSWGLLKVFWNCIEHHYDCSCLTKRRQPHLVDYIL